MPKRSLTNGRVVEARGVVGKGINTYRRVHGAGVMKESLVTQARVVAAGAVEPQRIDSQRRVKVTEGVCAQSVKTHSRIAGAATDVEVKRKLPNGSIPDAGGGLAKGAWSSSAVLKPG